MHLIGLLKTLHEIIQLNNLAQSVDNSECLINSNCCLAFISSLFCTLASSSVKWNWILPSVQASFTTYVY